ncbi:MAG: phosphatidylserine decarboxylase family protein [Candidatus Hydrogenedentes bacterium]|nr:phosphatidylserine decarboxylase family protein [Candidatus Hydrogenedentota bacterium]
MKNRVNGWIIGSRYYLPCFIVGVLLLIIGIEKSSYPTTGIGSILLISSLLILAFFRDFPRKISAGDREFVSPADGKIVEIDTANEDDLYGGRCVKIAIFMSVFNAHVNRSPFRGVVKKVLYKKGKFINAMMPEAGKQNESNTIWLETERGAIIIKQIAGLIARRIVCNLSEGEYLEVGEKFGMIKFGSRVELLLPPEVELYVKLGDKVFAGTSILGRFL